MGILNLRSRARMWWFVLLVVIASGAGYVLIVYSRWDTMAELAGANEKEEYTDKDLMQCGAGTHQEGGRCVANKGAPAPAPPAVPAPGGAKPAPK